jgi:hypothetical protein
MNNFSHDGDRRLCLNKENVLLELADAVLKPNFDHNSKSHVKFIN